MKTVLVTGASGFIGMNLVSTLEQDSEIKVLKYDKGNTKKELDDFIKKSDFIFHLAGINRPKTEEEFDKGNRGFTEELLELITESEKKIPIAVTSSIQAELENPYGISKKAAEDAVFAWAKKTKNVAYVYRLPNVFGKWCRPNYNSAVATFCHNIANGLPIQINDPKTQLTLVYIDDVIKEFKAALNGVANVERDGFGHVKTTYKTTLQELTDVLYSFLESRKTLVEPNFESNFTKALYATYTTYLAPDDFGYGLEMKRDDRGWLSEFIKSPQFGQIFVSKTKPGITRGNHWHHTKIEKFLVLSGEAEIRFRKVNAKEVINYAVSGEELKVVDIPAGFTHSIKNIGKTELITLFWSDEIFNQAKPDTYYLEV